MSFFEWKGFIEVVWGEKGGRRVMEEEFWERRSEIREEGGVGLLR